jgi:hypothetical protein
MITVQQNGKSRTFTCTVYCTAELPSQDIHMTTIQKNRKSRTFTCTVPILYSRTTKPRHSHDYSTAKQTVQGIDMTTVQRKDDDYSTVEQNVQNIRMTTAQQNRQSRKQTVQDMYVTTTEHTVENIQ